MTTIVYQYGLLAPSVNTALVREQMRSAHEYHNALIAIERDRRDKLRAATHARTEAIATRNLLSAARKRLGAARKALAAARKEARTDPALGVELGTPTPEEAAEDAAEDARLEALS